MAIGYSKEMQTGRQGKKSIKSEAKLTGQRKPINPVSKRQLKELTKRKKLKAELIEESGGLCMICGKPPDFRGLDLIHKKALSAGGKTNRINCLVGCQKCHHKECHHLKESE